MQLTNIVLWGFALWIKRGQSLSSLLEAFTMDHYSIDAYVALHGMTLDKYYVVTADNWRLQAHRIRNPAIFNSTFSTPVLVSHGTMASSADMMLLPRSESLAFVLADHGYDVWLANHRGDQFSSEKMTSSGTPYEASGRDIYETAWQFMADYDIPAFLELILGETGQEKIHLISHSQGGAIIPAFFASNHSYDDKIGHFVSMAPSVLYGDDLDLPLKIIMWSLPPIIERLPKFLFEPVVQWQLTGSYHSWLAKILYPFCYLFPYVCRQGFSFYTQRGVANKLLPDGNLDEERATVIATASPGGTSVMAFYTIAAQLYMPKKDWTKIDYRKIPQTKLTNEQMYNSTEPPKFNFPESRLNTTLMFTRDDQFTGLETAGEIISWLKPTNVFIVDDDHFGHIDFLYSWRARCVAYDFFLEQLADFEVSRGEDHGQYHRSVDEHVKSLGKPRCVTQKNVWFT